MVRINVANIKKDLTGKKDIDLEASARELELEDTGIKFLGSVSVKGEISNAGDVLLLQVHVAAKVERTCSRCLKEFEADTGADVTEKYYPAGSSPDEDALTYENDQVDITEPVREALILSEPISALCREGCLGICPVCGKDRNVELCSCEEKSVDPRLLALRNFSFKN